MIKKYFIEGKTTENFIELLMDDENAVWLEKYYIDVSSKESIAEFHKLIDAVFVEAKNEGGEVYCQYVTNEDWDAFLNIDDRWEVIQKVDDTVHIICDINDAPNCILDAFQRTAETIVQ
jgi:hypothetical protein